ncbi:MFS transporter [Streptomyces sp. XM4193]|uniref:MFS transporter n=1 Tax=Streptomyces sp. XM4193 TaxID=2929782 RepID=UPI001FFAC640|nr:MFS transporter [Streptomyces sp. XM4193]MCK1794593.1 MFS transporter [Streptomyces sp. XM4193]
MTTEAAQDRNTAPPPGAGATWGTLFVVLVGAFITVLDYFIVNVAVPSVQSDLGATASQSQLVIIGYGVAFTAGMITGGRLGDLYGRRRMYSLGLALFTLASLACGLAPDPETLIAARIAQGIAAALLVPQVLGILSSTYEGERRGKAFNAYGLAVGMAGVFGQLVGGLLISSDIAGLGWRTIFLINLPVCLVALACTRRWVPESRGDSSARLDVLGAVLVTVALVAVVLPLVHGHEHDWPAWGWVVLAASVPLLLLFVAHQRRLSSTGRSPLIELALFRERSFSVGLLAMVTYFMAMGSFFFLLAYFLQQGRGYSPLESGLIFFPLGVGYFGATMLSGRLSPRANGLGPATLGVGYALLGTMVLLLGEGTSVVWTVPALIVAGLGMGMTTGPLTGAVLAGVTERHAASASGAVNTMQEGGAALGVAIAGTVFFPVLTSSDSFEQAFVLGLAPLVVFCAAAAALWRGMHPASAGGGAATESPSGAEGGPEAGGTGADGPGTGAASGGSDRPAARETVG